MNTPALYTPSNVVVDVIQDGEEMAYVKFPDGKVLWVKSNTLDFDDQVGDDDTGLDSPTDFDEYEMNPDDSVEDYGVYDLVDYYDYEYDR